MCMYFHIQEHLFPWRARVFLKASITTSWPNACTSLCKCMCPFRISVCTPLYMCMYFFVYVHVFLCVCSCISLCMCMYSLVCVHVAFDVSMQAFGLVCIACVVPAHLFLSIGVCLLGFERMFFVVKSPLFLLYAHVLLVRRCVCLFWGNTSFLTFLCILSAYERCSFHCATWYLHRQYFVRSAA